MFSTRGSSKNAKLGLVEKLVLEKNDILCQNFDIFDLEILDVFDVWILDNLNVEILDNFDV